MLPTLYLRLTFEFAFMSRNIHLLKRAFLIYVRPIVEHNSVIWSPYTAGDIDAVESVQRRFTKRLPSADP